MCDEKKKKIPRNKIEITLETEWPNVKKKKNDDIIITVE